MYQTITFSVNLLANYKPGDKLLNLQCIHNTLGHCEFEHQCQSQWVHANFAERHGRSFPGPVYF